MSQDKKLKQLKDHIVGLVMKLTVIESDLKAVEGDLVFLESMKLNMEENIKILKKDGIVTIAAEYKKIMAEKATLDKNLTFYINVKNKLLRDQSKYEKLKDDSMNEFERLSKNEENQQVIVQFDPSKRKK
ncbi:MAG TPA: hypothetical protein DDY18_06215 [Flavobacterium sp.]|jgi:hypothetical protein|nr:hypothetical protein [Flavobacterium sp.]